VGDARRRASIVGSNAAKTLLAGLAVDTGAQTSSPQRRASPTQQEPGDQARQESTEQEPLNTDGQ
jgi:hypothetical protein